MSSEVAKSLRIKTGACQRLAKEVKSYYAESEKDKQRLDEQRAAGADEHDLKQLVRIQVPSLLLSLSDPLTALWPRQSVPIGLQPWTSAKGWLAAPCCHGVRWLSSHFTRLPLCLFLSFSGRRSQGVPADDWRVHHAPLPGSH